MVDPSMRRNLPILAAFLVTTACQVTEQANDNAVTQNDDQGTQPPPVPGALFTWHVRVVLPFDARVIENVSPVVDDAVTVY